MKRKPKNSYDTGSWRRILTAMPVFLIVGLALVVDVQGWQFGRAVAVEDATQDEDVEDGEGTLDGEGKYVGGAPLKTDPDLMDRLKKADEFRKDGNFRVASKLWQSVLGESGDILFSDDNETYYSLTEQVESILAELPEAGLRSYRIAADAAARELLAQSDGDFDLEVLTRVVKGYFMSSFGDDAAYKLGCIYLDQYDFVGAARLFRKVAEQYPDPSVPLDEVWLRIAISYTYVGDRESANEALDKARAAGADPESRLFEAIVHLMSESPQLNRGGSAGSQWTTRFGSVKRTGQMPALPEGYDSGNLKADWQFHFRPENSYPKDAYRGETIAEFAPVAIRDSISRKEKEMVRAWRKGKWRPAGHLLFNENHIIFKTGADVTVWNRQLENEPAWRPLWLNQFAIDEASAQWKQMFDTYRYERTGKAQSDPTIAHHIQMFGDQIAQSMSIHRGVLYNIEGKEYSWKDERLPSTKRSNSYPYGSVPRRTRTNRLSAYNMENGKIMWRLPTIDLLEIASKGREEKVSTNPDEEVENHFDDIGFMAAPVGFGDLLLAPVNVSGSVWLYALDSRNQGQLVWKSYLCDEPGGGSQPWSPIHIAIDGSTAYVSCGTGVVFAVDSMTGGIRFARRYSRTGETNNFMQRYGGNAELLELDGWMEDLVIPVGKELIMFASDYNAVWAIDRQSAKFRWKTDNRPFGKKFDYLIGMNDEYIFLGGVDSVAAVSIKAQGRWAWVHTFDDKDSLGRAMLTQDAIYVPLDKKIVKLGLAGNEGSGDVQAEIQVRLGTEAPLGNLYSDGERIWVVGGNRLYALGPDDGSIVEPKDEEESEQESSDASESEDKEGEVAVDR